MGWLGKWNFDKTSNRRRKEETKRRKKNSKTKGVGSKTSGKKRTHEIGSKKIVLVNTFKWPFWCFTINCCCDTILWSFFFLQFHRFWKWLKKSHDSRLRKKFVKLKENLQCFSRIYTNFDDFFPIILSKNLLRIYLNFRAKNTIFYKFNLASFWR